LESVGLPTTWSKLHDSRYKTKIPSSTTGTKELLRGTTRIVERDALRISLYLSFAITGFSVTSYSAAQPRSLMKPLFRENRRVRSLLSPLGKLRSRWALCWASTSLSQLADGITYYSCRDFLHVSAIIAQERPPRKLGSRC
jgi:hypothetical protein